MASIAKTGLLILLCNSLIASIYAEALSPDEFKRIVLDKLGSMHGKIAGAGENPVAAVGQFPYQVSLQDWYFDEHFCSGAIISEKWILTAAQCVYGLQSVKQIKAVVGTNDLTAGTDYKIREFYVPELEKDQPNHRRDIALLKTKKKIVFNELVAPIELPKQVARVNEKGIVSGWGDSIVSNSLFSSKSNCTKMKTHNIFSFHDTRIIVDNQNYCGSNKQQSFQITNAVNDWRPFTWHVPCTKTFCAHWARTNSDCAMWTPAVR